MPWILPLIVAAVWAEDSPAETPGGGDCPSEPVTDWTCVDEQCQNCEIRCAAGKACTVQCLGHSKACEGMKLDCSDSTSCDVLCDGAYGCAASDITCPTDGNCSLACQQPNACEGIAVTGLEATELKAACIAKDSCSRATFACPASHECSVQCLHEKACYSAKVSGGSLTTLDCAALRACEELDVMNSSGLLCANCTGERACEHATFSASEQPECLVDCMGDTSCEDALFQNCTAFCRGNKACDGTDLPDCSDQRDNTGSCSWDCSKHEGECEVNECPSLGPTPLPPQPAPFPTSAPSLPRCPGEFEDGVFTCSGTSCQGCEIVCPAGDCTVHCVGDQVPCQGMHVDCSQSFTCDIVCEGAYSCSQSAVTCRGADCNIDCTLASACEKMLLDGGENGNTTMHCNSKASCLRSWVKCPRYGGCEVSCDEEKACFEAQVLRGGFSDAKLSCAGLRSCESLVVSAADIGGTVCMSCDGERSCEGAKVTCGNGTACVTECQGHTSCYGFNMDGCTNSSSTCDVRCREEGVCEAALCDSAPCISDCTAQECQSGCPESTCRFWEPLDPNTTSYDTCASACRSFTGSQDMCDPNSGDLQECTCRLTPPPVPCVPPGYVWELRTVFRSRTERMVRTIASSPFLEALSEELEEKSGMIGAMRLFWLCPASACPALACPESQLEKRLRGCTTGSDIPETLDRATALELVPGDELAVVEYGIDGNTKAIEETLDEAVDKPDSPLRQEYGINNVEAVEVEVLAPPQPHPTPSRDDKDDSSFPAWAVVVICIVGVAALVVGGVAFHRSRRAHPQYESVDGIEQQGRGETSRLV